MKYFSTQVRRAEDDLDQFEFVSFSLGNSARFELRRYSEHPKSTVTLYFPVDQHGEAEGGEFFDKIAREFSVPKFAIAWRSGQPFEFGHLPRSPDDRLREPEARILALKIAAQQPARRASTEFIKQQISNYIQLSKIDLEPSQTRIHEQRWQQIVGNVISHRSTPYGPFVRGYARRTDDGVAVTDEGLAYLNNMGFSV